MLIFLEIDMMNPKRFRSCLQSLQTKLMINHSNSPLDRRLKYGQRNQLQEYTQGDLCHCHLVTWHVVSAELTTHAL